MPELLPILLIAVIVVVAIAVIAFLVRRRRAAQDAAIAAASVPVPELSEDDIAWRIGVSGADRPEGAAAAAGFAAAQAEAVGGLAAGTAAQLLPPPVVVEPAVAGPTRPRPVPPPLPNRWRLWRDSAAVLLVAVLAILAVTVLF